MNLAGAQRREREKKKVTYHSAPLVVGRTTKYSARLDSIICEQTIHNDDRRCRRRPLHKSRLEATEKNSHVVVPPTQQHFSVSVRPKGRPPPQLLRMMMASLDWNMGWERKRRRRGTVNLNSTSASSVRFPTSYVLHVLFPLLLLRSTKEEIYPPLSRPKHVRTKHVAPPPTPQRKGILSPLLFPMELTFFFHSAG